MRFNQFLTSLAISDLFYHHNSNILVVKKYLFSNLCLKDSRDGVDFISSGSSFHSRIVDGRNES